MYYKLEYSYCEQKQKPTLLLYFQFSTEVSSFPVVSTFYIFVFWWCSGEYRCVFYITRKLCLCIWVFSLEYFIRNQSLANYSYQSVNIHIRLFDKLFSVILEYFFYLGGVPWDVGPSIARKFDPICGMILKQHSVYFVSTCFFSILLQKSQNIIC